MLHFTGFDSPQVLSLAEAAYFFVQSNMITRLYQKPVVLAKYRRTILNSTSGNGTTDEHIIVNVRAGVLNDIDLNMFGAINKMITIGSARRAGYRLSRACFHKQVFDWAMEPADSVLTVEQLISRRAVNQTQYPVENTSYRQ
jgi:hypothetical protein